MEAYLLLILTNILFIYLYINEARKNKGKETLYKPTEEQYIEIKQNMDTEEDEGAKEYQGKYDILNSKYYKSLDIYNMKSSGSLILLEKFKTYQQTTSYSCGCASLIMALNYAGNEVIGEKDCTEKAETDKEYGTLPQNLEKTIKEYGYEFESKRTFFKENEEEAYFDEERFSEYIKESLKNKEPIIILSNDWGGHYTVIIGYDDMGTDNIEDDVLIVADPFDTTDHVCDGYTIWSFERLYYQMMVPYLEKYYFEFFKIKGKPK